MNDDKLAEAVVKVGSKYYPDDKLGRFKTSARDGQIITIRPEGSTTGRLTRKQHCVITLPIKYKDLVGNSFQRKKEFWRFKSTFNSKGIAKREVPAYEVNAEKGFNHSVFRRFFLDFELMVQQGAITRSQYDAIYDKHIDPGIISPNISFEKLILDEFLHTRLNEKKNQAITSGIYNIGNGLDYDTFHDAITAWGSPFDGDMTLQANDEEILEDYDVVPSEDIDDYTVTFTCQSGDKHNGTYGNSTHQAGDGARVVLDDNIEFLFLPTTPYDTVNCTIIIENLVFKHLASINQSYVVYWTAGLPTIYLRNCVGNGNGQSAAFDATMSGEDSIHYTYNNILYDYTHGERPVISNNGYQIGHTSIHYWYNNTVIDCDRGLGVMNTPYYGTYTVKNNLVQDCSITDYENSDQFDTSEANVSSDSSSPQSDYRNKDLRTNSIFQDDSGNDFRLNSGGDSDNLNIVNDGVDLSGIFATDIEDQERQVWYMGASEVVLTRLELGGIELDQFGKVIKPYGV